jgi:ionotropic glutamate receptor
LILVSLYIAKLTALFLLSSPDVLTYDMPFSNIEELERLNGKIAYGAKKGGSTLNFFKDSESAVYANMYQWMINHPTFLTDSNQEAIDKVEQGNYAYFMESTTIDFVTERNCDLMRVGGLLDSKGYGIAVEKSEISFEETI